MEGSGDFRKPAPSSTDLHSRTLTSAVPIWPVVAYPTWSSISQQYGLNSPAQPQVLPLAFRPTGGLWQVYAETCAAWPAIPSPVLRRPSVSLRTFFSFRLQAFLHRPARTVVEDGL